MTYQCENSSLQFRITPLPYLKLERDLTHNIANIVFFQLLRRKYAYYSTSTAPPGTPTSRTSHMTHLTT